MPTPPKSQNAVQPKTPHNLAPRKAEVHPKVHPSLNRQNATLQEDSDTEIDDVDEEHTQQDFSKKEGHNALCYKHDPNCTFRLLNVQPGSSRT